MGRIKSLTTDWDSVTIKAPLTERIVTMSATITKVQEVFFDLCDLLNSGQIDDIALSGFQEFATLREFLEEQKNKLAEIEESVK
mgnify:CR=1 FL=1